MYSKKLKLIIACFTLLSLKVNAQNCSRCDIALTTHATDKFYSLHDYSLEESTAVLFSYDYTFWNEYENSTGKTASLDAAYSIFSGSFSQSKNQTSSQKEFEEFRKKYKNDEKISQKELTVISSGIASTTAYDAWTTCIKSCGGGLFLEAEPMSNEEFIVTLNWIPSDGLAKTSKVTQVICTNCIFEPGRLKEDVEINPFTPLSSTLKRTNENEDISIIVNVEDLGQQKLTIKGNTKFSEPVYWNFNAIPFKYTATDTSRYPLKEVSVNSNNGLLTINTHSIIKAEGTVFMAATIRIPEGYKYATLINGNGMLSASSFNWKTPIYTGCTATFQARYFWGDIDNDNLRTVFEGTKIFEFVTNNTTSDCPKTIHGNSRVVEIPANTKEITLIIRFNDKHPSREYSFVLDGLMVQFY